MMPVHRYPSSDPRSVAKRGPMPCLRATSRRLMRFAALILMGLVFMHGGVQSQTVQRADRLTLPDGRQLQVPMIVAGAPAADGGITLLTPGSGAKPAYLPGAETGRLGASVNLLPNGVLVVLGGRAGENRVSEPLAYSWPLLERVAVEAAFPAGLPRARVGHAAIALIDGRVLLIGGTGTDGRAISVVEIWDPTNGAITSIAHGDVVQVGVRAEMLGDGRVLVWGVNASGGTSPEAISIIDPFDSRVNRVTRDELAALDAGRLSAGATVSAMWPGDGIAAGKGLVSARFSKPMEITSINGDTVALFGPGGIVSARVFPSLDGMHAYIAPSIPLLPGSTYTLFVKGVRDLNGQGIAFFANALKTQVLGGGSIITGREAGKSTSNANADRPPVAAATTTTEDDGESESFSPGKLRNGMPWRTNRPYPDNVLDRLSFEHDGYRARRESALPALKARFRSDRDGVDRGGIEGLVLKLNDKPLVGATIRIAGREARTDSEGRFEIRGVRAGTHELAVDGSSANTRDRQYGKFFIKATIEAGEWTRMPHAIFVARIRDRDWSNITAPARQDILLTHPEIPGLEVHIPRGAVLRDREGKILTRVAIVPIPIDRAAFPPQEQFPVYFSLQPGGLMIQGLTPESSGGIRVVYPNRANWKAGSAVQFVDYDPDQKGWHRYGNGRVSADGRQILPDAGVGLYKAMSSSAAPVLPQLQSNAPPGAPTTGNPLGCGSSSGVPGTPGVPDGCGDPVHTSTGTFSERFQDLSVGDGIGAQRLYRSRSLRPRQFGVGHADKWDMYLYVTPDSNGQVPNPIPDIKLVLPSGDAISFMALGGSPSGGWESTFEATAVPGPFYKAKIRLGGGGFELVTNSGDRYIFNVSNGGLEKQFDRYGNLTSFLRSLGRLLRIISPSGRYVDFEYAATDASLITKAKDATGRAVNYEYSFLDPGTGTQLPFLTKVTYPDATFEQYTYNASGNMLAVTDRRGNVKVTNQYDGNQRVTQQTLAGGATYQFAYTLDGGGNVTQTSVTDPRAVVTRFQFNANRYVTQKIAAHGTALAQTTSVTYQAGTNLLLTQVDPLNRTTAYTYDVNGNILTVTRLSGTGGAVTDTFTWTADFNRVATYRNALNQTTTYTYDSRGNVLTVVNPLSHTTTYTYNQAGQVLTVRDPLNKTTTLTYDQYDLRSIQDPLSRITTLQTDILGRRTSAVDPLGNRTYYEYNVNDFPTKVTNPQGGTILMQYDALGNLTQFTDPESRVTSFAHDARSRNTSRTDGLLRAEAFSYDGNSNLTQRTDRKSQVSAFQYDLLNRMTQATWHDGSQTRYTFDAAQRITQAQEFAAGNPTALQTITRSYDNLDRLTQEQSGLGTVSYGWNNIDQRTSLTLPGQAGIAYTWDAAGRLTQIQQGSGGTAKTIGFTYDAGSRRTQVTLANGLIGTYAYSTADQLTGITYMNGATTVGTLTYGFDTNGRITSQGGTLQQAFLPAATTAQATHDANNKLTTWNAGALTYDNHGNLTNDGTRTYTWDTRNRLVQVNQGATIIATYTYDPFGRRIKKVVNGTTTQFLHDGANAVLEYDQSNVLTAATLSGLSMDEWYMRTAGGVNRHYLNDVLGSTRALADDAKAIQTQYQYEPYGETTTSGAAFNNPYQFTGRENDGYGLYYYRARYYSPTWKRFLAEDPIGLEGGINTYAYVAGNPISLVDPTGKFWQVILGVARPIVAGGVAWGLGDRAANLIEGLGWAKTTANVSAAKQAANSLCQSTWSPAACDAMIDLNRVENSCRATSAEFLTKAVTGGYSSFTGLPSPAIIPGTKVPFLD